MPDPINPDEIPVDQLKADDVTTAAKAIKKLGAKTAAQGAVVQRTWHGLAHHYQAPESHGLLTIMDPVKTNTHTFGENTTTVAQALSVYAVEEERVKGELIRIKLKAQTFVDSTAGGVIQHHDVPKGGTVSRKVPWHEDQASVDANNALLAEVAAQLTALEDAQRTCANAVYDIIGFPPVPGSSRAGGTPADLTPQPMPWGAPVQRTERCGEKAARAYKHYAWDGSVVGGAGGLIQGVVMANAMAYTGYNPATGQYGDQAMYSKPLDTLTKTAVGSLMWLSPAAQAAAADTRGPIRRYLDTSKLTAKEAGKSIIGFDTWKTDPYAAAGTAMFNVATFFIPGAGEASAGIKVGAEAGRTAAGVEHLVTLDAYASSAADASRLHAQLVGEEIAGGHGFTKHVIEGGEYPQITTRAEFAAEIERVVSLGESRSLTNGRTGYWLDGTVVVRNPRAADGGTAFRPVDGYKYYTRGMR